MNIPYVIAGNGPVAFRFLRQMSADAERPRAVVLNNARKQRDISDLRDWCEDHRIPIHEWSSAARPGIERLLREDPRTWLLSIYFGHILSPDTLAAVDGRAVNLHPSLLPWCAGAHTNVYPIVEGCPAGVTLHVMTPEVDGGPILVQSEVPVRPWDTGASLYHRLEDEAVSLLTRAWPDLVLERWPGKPQGKGGSHHGVDELVKLSSYSLDDHPQARALFDLLRARSFPPYPGLRIEIDGSVVEATVSLKEIPGE